MRSTSIRCKSRQTIKSKCDSDCHFYVIVVLCQVSSGLDCICLKLFIKCYLKLKLLKDVNSSIVRDLHCYNFLNLQIVLGHFVFVGLTTTIHVLTLVD